MSDQEQKKDRLLKILAEVEPQAQRLEALGGDIISAARLSRDIAGPIHDLISQLPAESLPADQLNKLIQSGDSWLGAATDLEKSRTTVNTFVAISMNTTSTGSQSFLIAPSIPLPSAKILLIADAASRFRLTLERYPLLAEVETSMRRLRLDAGRPGTRTPFELLTEARGALEKPVASTGGALAVLLALRACIDSAINELIQRRRTQEPGQKLDRKIASLGRQCARPGLDSAHFELLASNGRRVFDELSGSKQADMSREELTGSFNRGLVFLNSLLSSLDETSLRPPTRG